MFHVSQQLTSNQLYVALHQAPWTATIKHKQQCSNYMYIWTYASDITWTQELRVRNWAMTPRARIYETEQWHSLLCQFASCCIAWSSMALRDVALRSGHSTSACYSVLRPLWHVTRCISRTARYALRRIHHVTRYDHDVYGAIRVTIRMCTAQYGAL
jgi:hypothetical protein